MGTACRAISLPLLGLPSAPSDPHKRARPQQQSHERWLSCCCVGRAGRVRVASQHSCHRQHSGRCRFAAKQPRSPWGSDCVRLDKVGVGSQHHWGGRRLNVSIPHSQIKASSKPSLRSPAIHPRRVTERANQHSQSRIAKPQVPSPASPKPMSQSQSQSQSQSRREPPADDEPKRATRRRRAATQPLLTANAPPAAAGTASAR